MDRIHFSGVGEGELDAFDAARIEIEANGWVTIYDRAEPDEPCDLVIHPDRYKRRESFPPYGVASVVWNVD